MITRSTSNSSFMIAERLLHTAVNFAVFAMLARSMGPELFGVFGLVQSLFLIGQPIALFASDAVVMKFALPGTYDPRRVYGSALKAKLVTSLIAYLLTVLAAWLMFGAELASLTAVFCLQYFFNADQLLFSYFRGQERSALVFGARAPVMLIAAIAKVWVVLNVPSIQLVCTVYVLEFVAYTLLASILFTRELTPDFQSDTALLKRLVSSAWPIMAATFLVSVYSRVDQLMIAKLMDERSLGIYTTAVKIGEASTYLMTAFILSRFPSLLRTRGESLANFDVQITRLLRLATAFGLLTLAAAALVARPVLSVVFGEDYLPSYGPLLLYLTGAVFLYGGVICTQWLVAEGLEFYRLLRVAVGLLINIALNLVWIPRYGILGAASATVVAQFGANVLFNLFNPRTRTFFWLQMRAIGIRHRSDVGRT